MPPDRRQTRATAGSAGKRLARPRLPLAALASLLGLSVAVVLLAGALLAGGRPASVAVAAAPTPSQTAGHTPAPGAVMTLATPYTGVRVGVGAARTTSATAKAATAAATPAANPGTEATPSPEEPAPLDPDRHEPGVTGTASPAPVPTPRADASSSTSAPAASILGALNSPIVASEYDDDPDPASGSPYYHVSPNLDDSPLRKAVLVVAVSSPGSTVDVREVIQSQGLDVNDPRDDVVVYHKTLRDVRLEPGCGTVVEGGASSWSELAAGLVSTGQQSSDQIRVIADGCNAGTVGVLRLTFPVSRALPPGWYDHCVAVITSGEGARPTCRAFHVNPVSGYRVDTETIDFGRLEAGVSSTMVGDFDLASTNAGTVISTGNTALVLTVQFGPMRAKSPSTGSLISEGFGVALRRRDAAGRIVASDEVGSLHGAADPLASDPFAGAEPAVLSGVCLEPGEPVRLDFSVQPSGPLVDGDYDGDVRISAAPSSACVATLGPGEGAAGDTHGPWHNTPGIPVSQVNLNP